MNVLIVDIGGSHVKLWFSESGERRQFNSHDELSPQEMVSQALDLVNDWPYDVVALGLPSRVVQGRPAEEPPNLGQGWIDFDYAAAFGKPVRMMNDADLQALGSYRGGRMLFVGLGTGVGSTLIAHQTVISLDLGRLLHEGEEIAELLGKGGDSRPRHEQWQRLIEQLIPRLAATVFADDVVIGGGEAEKLDRLPAGARRGDNAAVVQGGIRLWQELPDPAASPSSWRLV
jgi:polyphosphate glucokinase